MKVELVGNLVVKSHGLLVRLLGEHHGKYNSSKSDPDFPRKVGNSLWNKYGLTGIWETSKLVRMKVTVDLPDDLVRKVKIRAVNEGQRLKEAMTDLLRRGLCEESHDSEEKEKTYKIELDKETGLLVVYAREPGKPASGEEIQRLIQETQEQEDLERAGLSL